MRRLLSALVLGPLALLASSAPGARAQAVDFGPVTRLLADSLPRLGGGELIVMQHGRVLYRRSFAGWDSTRAVPIASASKWLSGGLVMSLVGDGTLRLDDTVGRWIPDAPLATRPITLRQLFSHTSGMDGGEGVGDTSCLDTRATTLDACARELLALPLRAGPGEAFEYGGYSMQVAGRLAELAAGRPFKALFQERIAGPLGLTRTTYGAGANPRVPGGVLTTAGDYARFLQMVLDGGVYGGARVLTEEAAAALVADQTAGARIAFTPYARYGSFDPALPATRYGIGAWRERTDPETGRLLDASSQGAFGFSPWIDFERGVVGVLAVRDAGPNVFPTYHALKNALRAAIPVATAAGRAPRPDAPTLDAPAPHPADGASALRFTLPAATHARLAVFDALGRAVAVLADGVRPAGAHVVPFPAGMAPGVYLVRLATPGAHRTRTVVVR